MRISTITNLTTIILITIALGFSVVAVEVRKLVLQTQDFLGDIDTIMQKLYHSTGEVNTRMQGRLANDLFGSSQGVRLQSQKSVEMAQQAADNVSQAVHIWVSPNWQPMTWASRSIVPRRWPVR